MISQPVRHAAVGTTAVIVLVAAVAGLVWVLQDGIGVPNASSVFLLAVVVAAVRFGTTTAIGAAVAAFLVYDALFIEPRLTLRVADPGEWLNLVLLLVVGIVVGRLAAGQRDRAEAALAREHEAVSLFRLSRVLATRSSTADVLPELATILQAETAMVRIRITLAVSGGLERTAVDTAPAPPGAAVVDAAWTPPASHHALRRTPGDAPAEWVRVHQQISAGSPRGRADAPGATVRRTRARPDFCRPPPIRSVSPSSWTGWVVRRATWRSPGGAMP